MQYLLYWSAYVVCNSLISPLRGRSVSNSGPSLFFDVGPLHDRLPFTYTPRSSPIRFHATKTKAVGDRALVTSTSHPPDEDVNAVASYAQSAATWSAGRHRFRCEMRLCGWK